MLEKLRMAWIGCGGMGRLHAENASNMPEIKMTAFVDVMTEKAAELCRQFGGDYSTDQVDRVLADQSIDAVLIATGHSTHAPLAIKAAEAGKHVFIEKPLAPTFSACREIEAAVARAGVKLQVGFCFRYAPLVNKALEVVGPPKITIVQCAGTIDGQACHKIDLLVNFFHRSPLQAISAAGARITDNPPDGLPIDNFAATLRFADGSIASYTQHYIGTNPYLSKFHLQLFGEHRGAYLAQRFKEVHFWGDVALQGIILKTDDLTGRRQHGYMGHFEELQDFANAVLHDRPVRVTAEEGRRVQEIQEAIIDAATTGRTISFPGH